MGILNKKVFRREILRKKRLLSETEYELRNTQFLSLGTSFLDSIVTRGIHIYLPIVRNNEPNSFPLLQHFHLKGKPVYISQTDFDKKEMVHILYDENTVFENNHLEIPEPVAGNVSELKTVDVILVPLVAVDKRGNRIGYGGGYYDRLLSDIDPDVKKVGASLSYPFDFFTFTDSHDIQLDYCITPFEILSFND